MLAFTFPGQGSQKPAMGAPWRDHPSWALVELAGEDAALGRGFSAGAKLHRASLYYLTAERMQPPGSTDDDRGRIARAMDCADHLRIRRQGLVRCRQRSGGPRRP